MLIAILAFSLAVSAQNVRDTVNAGIAAFRSARYDEAIALFTRAVMMDPRNLGAHLYLATSYMQLCVPGNDAPENQANAAKAVAEFNKALELDSKNVVALESLGSIAYNTASTLPASQKSAKLHEAADYNRRIVEIDATNKEAHYWIGVIR